MSHEEGMLLSAIREKDYEGVGVLLAQLLDNDTVPILRTMLAMAEEHNMISLCGIIEEWAKKKGVDIS